MVRLNFPLAETPNAKDYIEFICEIRKLALYNEFEENIPTIVVFGDRSSGKSSVLQRLTGGLPMPRNRRPVKPREVEFADIIDLDEAEIEEKLREAQRYAQNPSITDVENTRLPPDTDELAFTKNAVCVTISGPDQICSLSMVELPGK
ncbi:hypothetical protein C1645_305159 [Glomus cerebriforme]|uniref:Uncharacterized protein n=1 Tax=Glomus cerebriforme TaxID=658196 RepID=A0A397SSZ4_9GLOM|nr:hypothetical protein C1645_305159 [Glomus cerebriforme]